MRLRWNPTIYELLPQNRRYHLEGKYTTARRKTVKAAYSMVYSLARRTSLYHLLLERVDLELDGMNCSTAFTVSPKKQ